jgi:hypothetical protein
LQVRSFSANVARVAPFSRAYYARESFLERLQTNWIIAKGEASFRTQSKKDEKNIALIKNISNFAANLWNSSEQT